MKIRLGTVTAPTDSGVNRCGVIEYLQRMGNSESEIFETAWRRNPFLAKERLDRVMPNWNAKCHSGPGAFRICCNICRACCCHWLANPGMSAIWISSMIEASPKLTTATRRVNEKSGLGRAYSVTASPAETVPV